MSLTSYIRCVILLTMTFIKLYDNDKTRVNLDNVVSYNQYDNSHSQHTKFAIFVRHTGGVAKTDSVIVYNDVRDRDEDLKRIDTLLGL